MDKQNESSILPVAQGKAPEQGGNDGESIRDEQAYA